LYDYDECGRSKTIASSVTGMVDRYRRDEVAMSDDDVRDVLAIPMWVEAAIACRDGVVQSSDELDLAMRGGLGYDPEQSWLGFFDRLGSSAILSSIQRWSDLTPAIAAPPGLIDRLGSLPPRRALESFATEG
jgi:hypothetical protein